VALPYWDSTLDQNMPDARDSVLWTPQFFGESDSVGNVINGPFGTWQTLTGRSNILRHIGSQGSLFTDNELNTVLQQVMNSF
jgi:tyrosinase